MAYRDDQAALESRRGNLQHEIASIQTRSRELGELVKSEAALARELADVEARIAKAAARRLTMLDDIKIASPCPADWDAMRGDDRVRFCEKCEKNVYNLSAMTRAEAEALIAEREGSLCVRLYKRADGTVLTNDCPVGVRKKRIRRVAFGAVGAGAMAAASLAAFGRAQPAQPEGQWIAGGPTATAVGTATVPPEEPATVVTGAPSEDLPPVMGKPQMQRHGAAAAAPRPVRNTINYGF